MNAISSKILYGLACFIGFYIIFRGFYLSITVDEASSYIRYAQYSFGRIYTYDTPTNDMLPNNHLLNSFLMRIGILLLGSKDWVLRLPNMIVSIIAIWYGVKLVRLLSSEVAEQCLFFALLFFNEYYLQFFSLARGYGLLHSFMIISLYHTYFYLENTAKLQYLIGGLLAGILAAFSNFSGLNYFIILAFLLLIDTLLRAKQQHEIAKKVGIILAAIILCVLLIWRPLKKVVDSGQSFGGQFGFYKDTLYSLAQHYIGNQIFCQIFLVIILLFSIFALYLLFKEVKSHKNEVLKSGFGFFTCLFFLLLLAPIVQAFLYKTPYLLNRTALIYIPIWGLFASLAWQKMTVYFTKESLKSQLTWGLFGILSLIFGLHLNFYNVSEWRFDAHTKQALQAILADKKARKVSEKQKIGVFNYTHSAFYFYITTDASLAAAIEPPQHHEELIHSEIYDYYYVTDEVPAAAMQYHYTLLADFGGGYGLWRRK